MDTPWTIEFFLSYKHPAHTNSQQCVTIAHKHVRCSSSKLFSTIQGLGFSQPSSCPVNIEEKWHPSIKHCFAEDLIWSKTCCQVDYKYKRCMVVSQLPVHQLVWVSLSASTATINNIDIPQQQSSMEFHHSLLALTTAKKKITFGNTLLWFDGRSWWGVLHSCVGTIAGDGFEACIVRI